MTTPTVQVIGRPTPTVEIIRRQGVRVVRVTTPGMRGATGEGVPAGGTLGQVLRRAAGADYSTVWGTLTPADVGADAAGTAAAGVAAHLSASDPHPQYTTPAEAAAAAPVQAVSLAVPAGWSASTSNSSGNVTLTLALPSGTSLVSSGDRVAWDQAAAAALRWDGSATGLDAAAGRVSLGLGTAAQSAVSDFATAAQGALAATAVQPAALSSYVQTGDVRLSDAREWSADTITQAEAEGGTATTRRAFTAARVFQAIAAWWAASAAATKLSGIASGATANSTDAQLRDRSTHTGTQPASTISDFAASASAAAPVQSVAGKTGTITLAKGDVGLSNVDNTSDADKPVSTSTATALAGKASTGSATTSGLTMATARLLGRTTAGAGAVEEIQVVGGTFASGVLTTLPSPLTADANGNLTFTARWIQSTHGAASAPAHALTGTWFTGGTSTTTKPHFLIEPAGTTSTAFNTAGTGFGVNAPNGFTGDLAWFGVNGANQFVLASNGRMGIGVASPTAQFHVRSVGSGTVALFGDSASNNSLAVTRITTGPAYVALQVTTSAGALTGGPVLRLNVSAEDGTSVVERARFTAAGIFQWSDGLNISFGTTTGTRFGTATTQRLGFWNATPAVQPAAVADATDAATVITQLNTLLSRLRTIGLIAT